MLQAAAAGDYVGVACQKEVMLIKAGSKVSSLPVEYESQSVALSPDGAFLAVGTATNKVVVYSTSGDNLAEVKVLEATGIVNCVSFAPNGQFLASGDSNRNVFVFEVGSWDLVSSEGLNLEEFAL